MTRSRIAARTLQPQPHSVMRILISGLCGILTTVYPQYAVSQAPIEPISQISVASHGEVHVNPDRAQVQISVQTRASTAAAASTENARKQKAVMDALRGLGLTDEQLSTIGYSVSPEMRYDRNSPPVVVAYVVTNTIVAQVRQLTLVGSVLDAALAKGANVINSLTFEASNTDQARLSAIAIAVQRARSEAEAGAKAAGGSLGELLEITIGQYYQPPPRPMLRTLAMTADAGPETPINPGQETVSVDLGTRWRFVAQK
jgi:uncharacterized protein YggE